MNENWGIVRRVDESPGSQFIQVTIDNINQGPPGFVTLELYCQMTGIDGGMRVGRWILSPQIAWEVRDYSGSGLEGGDMSHKGLPTLPRANTMTFRFESDQDSKWRMFIGSLLVDNGINRGGATGSYLGFAMHWPPYNGFTGPRILAAAGGVLVPLPPPDSGFGGGMSPWDSALRSDFSYIPEDLDPPKATLHARDLSHTEIEVAFDPLTMPVDPNFGPPKEIALVRSPSGFPTTLLDGIMVRRHPPVPADNTGWVRIPDSGLTPGAWYYYGLFAKYFSEGNTHWLRVAERSILLPQEYLSGDHLWERIPEWYRRQDMEPGGVTGTLRRVVDVIGYQTDAHRTWALTVGDVWDAEKMSADLLPYLGETLGQPVEYAAGDERYRALISRILPLRKIKGTEKGTEAYLSSITGYRTRVYPGLNLLPTVNEAEARHSNGLWQGTFSSSLTRVVSTGAATPGPAAGRCYHRLTYNGTTSQRPALRLGNGSDLTRMIPVIEGHEIVTSAFYRSSYTGVFNVRYRWFSRTGALRGSQTVAFGVIDSPWARLVAPAVTVPIAAAFAEVNLELSVHTTIDGLVTEVTDIMITDLSWRPEDVPGAGNTPPLSTPDIDSQGEYDHENYYETPRTVHVNVYPQRINYAYNSDFSMDNIPPDAWTIAERATWGLLKVAYENWGDIHDDEPGDSEEDWGDLAEGFEPLASNWEISFDTLNKRLVMTTGGPPTYIAQVQSHFFPVVPDDAISAAFLAWATIPGVLITLSVDFFTDEGAQFILSIDGVTQNFHSVAEPMTLTQSRYELRNAIVPEGAAFARITVDMRADQEYTGYLREALIENSPIPGAYFNGDEVDSAFGDFFFTGKPHESYSVYYQNYRSFINDAGGGDRITSLMEELLPMEADFVLRTAAGGLY